MADLVYRLTANLRQVGNLQRSLIQAQGSPAVSFVKVGADNHPRVIFIHGTPGTAQVWSNFIRQPIPDIETIALDRLGFGQSPTPDNNPASFRAQAVAIAPLLVQRDGVWPILVGHSLGGPIAAYTAGLYPERVSGLVIAAGSLDPELERPNLLQRFFGRPRVARFLTQPWRIAAQEVMAAKKETTDLAPLLGNITCRVQIVHGTRDWLVPHKNVEYMRRNLTNAQIDGITLIPGGSHFIPQARPQYIRAAIDALLARAI